MEGAGREGRSAIHGGRRSRRRETWTMVALPRGAKERSAGRSRRATAAASPRPATPREHPRRALCSRTAAASRPLSCPPPRGAAFLPARFPALLSLCRRLLPGDSAPEPPPRGRGSSSACPRRPQSRPGPSAVTPRLPPLRGHAAAPARPCAGRPLPPTDPSAWDSAGAAHPNASSRICRFSGATLPVLSVTGKSFRDFYFDDFLRNYLN